MTIAILFFIALVKIYILLSIGYRCLTYRGRGSLMASFLLPKWQAHRGYHLSGVQENTLASMRECKRRGSIMAECDVQVSSDGVVFLYHDADLKRLHGDQRALPKVKSTELMALGLTTLEEVLVSDETPEKINIELKTAQIFDSKLERALAKLLNRLPHKKKILFSSFNPFSLMKLAVLRPEVPRALLACEEKVNWNKIFLRKLWLLPFCQADLLHLDQHMIRAEHVQLSRRRDLTLVAWTVNERSQWDRLEQIGVQFFISDREPQFFSEAEDLARTPVRLF